MRKLAGDRQMTDVWRMPAIAPWEKTCGKHPAQKPLALVVRAILASTQKDDMILDPFAGSSTTGIAANMLGRKFVGIEQDSEFLKISKARRMLLDEKRDEWVKKIPDLRILN
jgi:site-specific DNA-methyltransferase (adenine-specific)